MIHFKTAQANETPTPLGISREQNPKRDATLSLGNVINPNRQINLYRDGITF